MGRGARILPPGRERSRSARGDRRRPVVARRCRRDSRRARSGPTGSSAPRGDRVGAARVASASPGTRCCSAAGRRSRAAGSNVRHGCSPTSRSAAEHAWLAVREAEVALNSGTPEVARAAAERAIAIGEQTGVEDVQVVGRSLEGRRSRPGRRDRRRHAAARRVGRRRDSRRDRRSDVDVEGVLQPDLGLREGRRRRAGDPVVRRGEGVRRAVGAADALQRVPYAIRRRAPAARDVARGGAGADGRDRRPGQRPAGGARRGHCAARRAAAAPGTARRGPQAVRAVGAQLRGTHGHGRARSRRRRRGDRSRARAAPGARGPTSISALRGSRYCCSWCGQRPRRAASRRRAPRPSNWNGSPT